MMPTSADVAKLLVDEGLGRTDGKRSLFVGVEPTRKKGGLNVVTIYDTGGIDLSDRLAIDNDTIQFRSRNADYLDGYSKLDVIKRFLEAKESVVVNSTRYVGFWIVGGIVYIGKDDNDLFLWTLNMRIAREPQVSESGNRLTLRN